MKRKTKKTSAERTKTTPRAGEKKPARTNPFNK